VTKKSGSRQLARLEPTSPTYTYLFNFLKFKVDTPWKRNINEFTISSYGPETCDFSPAPIAIPPTMISDCLSDLAETDKNGFTWYREQNQPNIGYKFMHCKDGFGFFYFKNSSADTTLTASVELTTLQGCELCKSRKTQN